MPPRPQARGQDGHQEADADDQHLDTDDDVASIRGRNAAGLFDLERA